MCMRFPFLYPRHRLTGKHYTNWKLLEKRRQIYCKWSEYSKKNMGEYYKAFGWDAFFKKNPDMLPFDFGDSDSNSDFDFDNEFFTKNFILAEYVMKLATKEDRFKYWWYGTYHKILEVFHCLPYSNELDAMDDGWKKNFGIQFCKDLRKAIIKDNGIKGLFDFRIVQMKEKHGRFECYVNDNTPNVNEVIDKYGDLSQDVCIMCGEKATKTTLGYVLPYCDHCIPETSFYVYNNPTTDAELKHNSDMDEILKKC